MRLSRWLLLVGAVVAVGVLQVAQRNAIFLKGYAVGERLRQVHTQETEVSWLNAEVLGLTSPTTLAQVAHDRRLKLVAWSTFPGTASSANATVAQGAADDGAEDRQQELLRLADDQGSD